MAEDKVSDVMRPAISHPHLSMLRLGDRSGVAGMINVMGDSIVRYVNESRGWFVRRSVFQRISGNTLVQSSTSSATITLRVRAELEPHYFFMTTEKRIRAYFMQALDGGTERGLGSEI